MIGFAEALIETGAETAASRAHVPTQTLLLVDGGRRKIATLVFERPIPRAHRRDGGARAYGVVYSARLTEPNRLGRGMEARIVRDAD